MPHFGIDGIMLLHFLAKELPLAKFPKDASPTSFAQLEFKVGMHIIFSKKHEVEILSTLSGQYQNSSKQIDLT